MLKGRVAALEEYYAVIHTEKGEVLYWPIHDLPKKVAIGEEVFASISLESGEVLSDQGKKDILNTLLMDIE